MVTLRLRGYLFATALAASPAIAQDQTKHEVPLGCILLNVEVESVDLEPWDAWQNWCDVDPIQSTVQCYLWDGEELQATRDFDAQLVLRRLRAGERTCPATPDSAKPVLRGG